MRLEGIKCLSEEFKDVQIRPGTGKHTLIWVDAGKTKKVQVKTCETRCNFIVLDKL